MCWSTRSAGAAHSGSSREDAGNFASLDELSLDELAGIGTSRGFYSDYKMPFGVNELDEDENTVRVIKYVTLDGSPTDFGDTRGTMFQDGNFDDGVAQDLNYAVDPPPDIELPGVSSPGETLDPHDDWANVLRQDYSHRPRFAKHFLPPQTSPHPSAATLWERRWPKQLRNGTATSG